MLTLLTATGMRHQSWALCEKFMQRQTYAGPVRWVVVDDGQEPQPIGFEKQGWTLEVIRPEPFWLPGDNTQARNLLAGMDVIGSDERVVFVEDDDWYSPNWLQVVDAMLARAELVGEGFARYYNVQLRKYRTHKNAQHASLCSSAIRGKALETFRKVCLPGVQFIDISLWQSHPDKHVFAGTDVVGIKGLPGRGGIGMGHKGNFLGDIDYTGDVLKSWVGADADLYQMT